MIHGTTPKPPELTPGPQTPEEARAKQASESRKALALAKSKEIREARDFWSPVHKRMQEDIDFAAGDQWHDAEDKMSDKYKANWVMRELNQQVSSLYAKNPTFTAERKARREYTVWDGTEASLTAAKADIDQAAMSALSAVQAGQAPQDPPAGASAIVKDYKAGSDRKQQYDNMADTLELLFTNELDSQSPNFETQMKALLLRERTVGAGFVTVKWQSEHESVITASYTQANVIERLKAINALAATLNSEPANDDCPCHEQLRLAIAGLHQELLQGEGRISQQGIILDFHPTTSIIIDPKTRSLGEFVGGDWIAEQLILDPEAVLAQWNVDPRELGGVVQYQKGVEAGKTVNLRTKAGGELRDQAPSVGAWSEQSQVCVWIQQNKRDQMRYVLLDGHDDFLEEPQPPYPPVQGFWHTACLKLTLIEVEENKPDLDVTCYGTSACRLLRPMQQEVNRSQEARREHRIANRPGHLCGKDTFSQPDRYNLAGRKAHDVIPLDNVPPGADLSKAMSPIPTVALDEALYETATPMQHAMLVSGTQQANIGQQGSNEKATGQAIAEQSRVQSVNSEADSQDKFLGTLARISGEMLFLAMDVSIVRQKVGPGAVFPQGQQQRDEVRQHLCLRVDAGSAGRPNRALEIANLQALMPQLIELAKSLGLPLDPLVKYAARVMEFDFDLDEWLGQAQPPQQGQQPERASESISIKLGDLTPDEREQALAMAGIKASPGGGPPPPATATKAAPGAAQAGPAALPKQAARMLPKAPTQV